MQNEKVTKFFESHPAIDEVHEALGVLFIEKKDAEAYLGGVSGYEMLTHTREKEATTDPDAMAKQQQKDIESALALAPESLDENAPKKGRKK